MEKSEIISVLATVLNQYHNFEGYNEAWEKAVNCINSMDFDNFSFKKLSDRLQVNISSDNGDQFSLVAYVPYRTISTMERKNDFSRSLNN